MKASLSLYRTLLIAAAILFPFQITFAQVGLEGIIVEEYYTSTSTDAIPALGIPGPVEGSVTYRIYVDMAPGWQLQQVAGFIESPISISTTTGFYNATGAGVQFADAFSGFAYNIGAVPLDSYFTFGIAGPSLAGVQKTDDTDGSIFDGANRLQGTVNPINSVDGMVPSNGEQLATQLLGSENLDIVNVNGSSSYFAENTIYFNLNGSRGIAPENKVLIAQLTTDGELSFEINVQIFNNDNPPSVSEVYTHSPLTGQPDDVQLFFHPDLIYPAVPIEGCTNAVACNFNTFADIDDGSCIIPVANCQICNEENTGLDIVDNDGDGLCNEEDPCPELANVVNGDDCITADGAPGTIANCTCVEVVVTGCTDVNACNFNPEANQNDGSCLIPIENCLTCNPDNTDLEIIDTDGDGICDAEEIAGCTSATACNFDENATDSSDDCIEPVENCQACNSTNTGLVIIDTDGDGICDAEEIAGCTSPEACNFDSEATDDDQSCLLPVEDCLACSMDNTELVLIDDDGDGVCNAEEIFGCTDPEAENYNPEATEDDGSCILIGTFDQVGLQNSVSIYPNPTPRLVHVYIDGLMHTGSHIEFALFDLLGNRINTWSTSENRIKDGIALDLGDNSPGIYLLRIVTENDQAAFRILKSN